MKRFMFWGIGAIGVMALAGCWHGEARDHLLSIHFNEGQGIVARESVSGVDLSIAHRFTQSRYKPSSEPYWRDNCIAGNCLKFDGYTSMLEASPLTMPKSSVLTISVWVAPQAYEWGDTGLPSGLIGQYQSENNNGFVLGIARHGEWVLQLGDGTSTQRLSAGSSFLPVDTWSLLAVEINKPNRTVTFYLNGELVAHHKVEALSNWQLPLSPLFVGRHPEAMLYAGHFYLHSFNGLMDELSVSPDAISESEHRSLFRQALVNGVIPKLSSRDTNISRNTFDGDKHRPQYHLMPDAHWMNEPHGPFYYNGKYHITFQKNPHGPFWHQIHWGHLVSDDMVHWEEVEIALRPSPNNLFPDGVWSGSATMDGDGNPVLFFTAGNDALFPTQRTAIARPKNLADPFLREWVEHPIAVTEQQKEWGVFGQFRDPYVFWDAGQQQWYQLVTSGIPGGSGTALVFASKNLLDWQYLGPLFSVDIKAYPQVGPVWELPVLLPLGTGKDGRPRHWFGINSHGEGAVVEIYYWIGVWDAIKGRFTPDHPEPRLMDIGDRKFTGPSGMVDPVTGRSILFSIAQGETTRQQEAESGWAHNGGLPLNLWLGEHDELRFAPIVELERLRGNALVDATDVTAKDVQKLLAPVKGDLLELEVTLEANKLHSASDQHSLTLELRKNPQGTEVTRVNLKPTPKPNSWRLELDRSKTTLDPDVLSYGVQGGDVDLNGEIKLRVFLDRSMIEVYVNDRVSLTSRLFPATLDALGLGMNISEGVILKRLRVWPMAGSHGKVEPVAAASFEYSESTWQSVLPNHDFKTCDLDGWQVVEGDAFTNKQVVSDHPELNASKRIPGGCHLLGYLAGGSAMGELRSQSFVLQGNGQVNFLIGGGMDLQNLYVAIVDAETGHELMRATGNEQGELPPGTNLPMRRVFWNLSDAVGKTLYFKVRDQAQGARAYLNVDDFHVPIQSTLIPLSGN